MENKSFTISTKQIAITVSSVVAFLGGETFIGAHILESKIQEYARPEIIRIVNHKADSILLHRKISFRTQIANSTHLPKDTITPVLSSIIKDEINKIFVGFFIDKSTNRIKYRHTDSEIYRPIEDIATGRFYIILDNGASKWCY